MGSYRARCLIDAGHRYAALVVTALTITVSIPGNAADVHVRKVDDVDITGSVSPSGRYISYMDGESGALAILDLQTLERRRITNSQYPEFVQFSAFSPDSSKIVYGWVGKQGRQLRTIGLDGGEPEVLYDAADIILGGAWSPDGAMVSGLMRSEQSRRAILVSTKDGGERFPTGVTQRATLFSPDSRYLIYSDVTSEQNQDVDILAYDLRENTAAAVVGGNTNDLVLGWAPDGEALVFLSDRGGSTEVWAVPVENGRAQAQPRMLTSGINPDITSIRSLGCSENGSCFFGFTSFQNDIYVADLDLGGDGVGQPRKVVESVGFDTSPQWSNDGARLAYVYGGRGPIDLAVYSVSDGVETRRPLGLERLGSHAAQPLWSPDGQSFLLQSWDLHRVDAETLEGSLAASRTGGNGGTVEWPSWLPDGRILFVRWRSGGPGPRRIIIRDLVTETETNLYETAVWQDEISHLCASPDGRWIAFVERGNGTVLKLRSIDSSQTLDLVDLPEPVESPYGQAVFALAWTPDSQSLIYAPSTAGQKKLEFWRVRIPDGEPEYLGLTVEGQLPFGVSVHPEGDRIAFAAGDPPHNEAWVVENIPGIGQ